MSLFQRHLGSSLKSSQMNKPKTLYSQESVRLAGWLRQQRENSGMTIRQLAEKLGWHYSIVGKIEQGERRIDVVEYLAYCSALGANPKAGLDKVNRRG